MAVQEEHRLNLGEYCDRLFRARFDQLPGRGHNPPPMAADLEDLTGPD